MKRVDLVKVIILLCPCFWVQCNEPSGNDGGMFSVAWTSVQGGDSLNPGGGVVIRFSGTLDLNCSSNV